MLNYLLDKEQVVTIFFLKSADFDKIPTFEVVWVYTNRELKTWEFVEASAGDWLGYFQGFWRGAIKEPILINPCEAIRGRGIDFSIV